MRCVDEDADANMLVHRVVIVKVEAADGGLGFIQVNHQTELFLAEQVVVIQQELLDLELCIGHIRSADTPNRAVVLPTINLCTILGLGATERNRVVFDEHGPSFVEKVAISQRIGM